MFMCGGFFIKEIVLWMVFLGSEEGFFSFFNRRFGFFFKDWLVLNILDLGLIFEFF